MKESGHWLIWRLCLSSVLLAACGQADPSSDTALGGANQGDAGERTPDVGGLEAAGETAGERQGADEPPDATQGAGAGPELSACLPPLSFVQEAVYVLPYGLAFFVPTGGTGAYELLLADDTIGTLNTNTGAFLAGPEPGLSSRIFVTDSGCEGVADVSIDVVFPMDVVPLGPQVPPGTSIPFRVEQGSGQATIELIADETGASLDGKDYVAGEVEGVDIISVRDTQTGQEVFVYVEVREDALLVPTTWWPQVAVGQTLMFQIDGGTGDLAITFPVGLASLEDGVLTGLEAGVGTIEIVDVIAGLTLTLPLGVAAPLSSSANRSGDLSAQAELYSADLDGDGYEELLVGVGEADVDAHNSGGVYVYRGGASGVSETPERIYATDDKEVWAGTAIAVGDFNADGQLDLAIGAPSADPGVTDGGVVRIHQGVAGGLPGEVAVRVLGGPFSGDEMGRALVACDFNADGVDDLVAAAPRGENRALLEPFDNQGALHLFLGRAEEGLADAADQTIYGHVLVEGALVQRPHVRLGHSVAAGDFDGDGACDLAVSTINWSFLDTEPNREDGGVFLYRGKHAEEGEAGGLEPTPSRIWGGNLETSVGTRFGDTVTMGDLNGDGRSDLLVSQTRYSVPGEPGVRHGAVNLFYGTPLANHPAEDVQPPSEAAWRGFGPLANALFGHDVHIADVASDGDVQVIVGDPRALNDDEELTGAIYVFEVSGDSETESAPVAQRYGAKPFDYFGTGVTVVDGELAVLAGRDDAYGLDVGCPYVTVDGLDFVPLEFPGIGTGDAYGRSVAFTGDLTGDGLEDLAVGVPLEDDVETGANSGVVMIYRGTTTGIESEPAAVLKGFRTHSGADEFGTQVYDLGDFDGDGLADLGVLSRFEDLPGVNAFGDGLFNEGACEFGSAGVGALYMFRGTSDGAPEAEPAFIIYGLKSGARVDAVLGGIDVNGDGRDDIVVGNSGYDVPGEPELNADGVMAPVGNHGAVAVYLGQPSAATGTTVVLCSPAAIITGRQSQGRFGFQIATLGDLDGDGCGDFVVSGVNEWYTAILDGGLHLIRGWGKLGCPDEPRVSVFSPGIDGASAGRSLAGGMDVDADGVPDLVMGASAFTANLSKQGMVWLVSGAYLASMPTFLTTEWTLDDVNPMWPFSVNAELYRIAGATKGARFGESLSLHRAQGAQGPAQVIVGAPYGALSGLFDGGGAYALEFSATSGFSAQPMMLFGGESARGLSQLGASVSTGHIGDRSMVVVGGPGSSAVSVDNGAAYVLDLTL